MRRRVFGFIVLVWLTSAAVVFSQAADPEVAAAGLVGDMRDAMYLQQEDDEALFQRFRILRADLGDLPLSDRQQDYWQSMATYYMARGLQALDTVEEVLDQDVYMRKGKFKKMQKSYARLDEIVVLYEEAMALAESYLEGGRDAAGVRLYTECLSQLSTLKTLGFLMNNGPKIQPLAEEAVELNPADPKARMILANRYVYSPGIWGGDPDRGIAMLEDIKAGGGLDIEDEHNIAVAIGFAHTMAERWDEAVPFFREALEVYPTNVYATAMLRLSEAGGP